MRRLARPLDSVAAPLREEPRAFGFTARDGWVMLAIALASIALYARVLHAGFLNLDDQQYVVDNPWIRGFTVANVGHVLSTPYFANYSPAHLLSYMLDHSLGGLDPVAFHASNSVWGAAVAVLVYVVARMLTRSFWAAAIAGALFVVHPAHVEAIAWISSRKDLVAAAFALLAMVFHFARYRVRRAWLCDLGALIAFAVGAAGKPSVVVVPAVLWVYDVRVAGRPWLRSALHQLPFVAVAALIALRAMGAQPSTRHEFELGVFGRATGEMLWLLTGLGDYVIYRDWHPAAAGSGAALAWSAFVLALAALAVVGFVRAKHQPSSTAFVLALWTSIALVPSQVLAFLHPVTDRYLFFPSAPAAILIGWGIAELAQWRAGWTRIAAVAAAVSLCALWTWKTVRYLDEWTDPRSVWYAASMRSSEPEPIGYLGTHYCDVADGLAAKDERARARAVAIAPLFCADATRARTACAELERGEWNGAATVAFAGELRAEAERDFRAALAVKTTRLQPDLRFRLAKLEFDRGDRAAARGDFERALAESQDYTFAEMRLERSARCHQALAVIAWYDADWDACLAHFREVDSIQRGAGATWVTDVASWIAKADAKRAASATASQK